MDNNFTMKRVGQAELLQLPSSNPNWRSIPAWKVHRAGCVIVLSPFIENDGLKVVEKGLWIDLRTGELYQKVEVAEA